MKNALYVYPETTTYAAGEQAALAAKLAAMDRVTQTPYIGALAQVQLDHEGKLPGGYRYTSTAFKQVCGLACPGLHQAVVDLSGIRRTSVQPRYDYSFADAVEVFNKALRIRYQERFDGKIRLIKDVKRHLVEGVMGPKYNFLENLAIYELSRDSMVASQVKVRFLEAILEGRRLMLRFVHVRPCSSSARPSTARRSPAGITSRTRRSAARPACESRRCCTATARRRPRWGRTRAAGRWPTPARTSPRSCRGSSPAP